jgi:HlyD family secretion protein
MSTLSMLRARRAALSFAAAWWVAACSKPAPPDAYGNFEAEEVVVSAETSGQLKSFTPTEGATLAAGAVVAQLDTVPMALERNQLVAQRAGLLAHRTEVSQQLQALDVQHEIALRARERVDRLYKSQAATAQQRDQTERDERVLVAQIASSKSGVSRTGADVGALEARIASANDRLRRATVMSPTSGTVLATYVRSGEMIQPGQALYRVANLDTITLRAYVTGTQLGSFTLGQSVQVQVDAADTSLRSYQGVVTWVSSRAEFTPTPVQTRDERANLVYAVKVRVANPDGALKIGMPADVTLGGARVAAK